MSSSRVLEPSMGGAVDVTQVFNESRERDAWREWLRTKKWDFWMTATFATTPSTYTVEQVARHYIAGFGERVYAALAVECCGLNGRPHAHLLVGGMGAHPEGLVALTRRWLWGDVRIAKYDPLVDPRDQPRGACAYICKYAGAVEMIGTAKKWRPRRQD